MRKVWIGCLLWCFIFCGLLGQVGLAAAQESATEEEGEEIVVTAERSAQNISTTPRAIAVVDRQEVFDKIGRTVPESLRQVAGVSVQRTNLGGGSPFIRGLVGNQVLYLVDGIRVNNSTFRGGPNQYLNTIDPFFIDRIEVVRGPGSVLYGSDALGGVINIITKRRDDLSEPMNWDGRLMSRATSAEREVTTHLDFDMNVGQMWGAAFSGNFRQFGDIQPGGTAPLQEPYGYEEQDFGGNLDMHFNDRIVWQFSAQHVNLDEVPNYDPTNIKNTYEPQLRNLYYTRLALDDLATGLEHADLFVSYHHQLEGRQKIAADDPTHETRDLDVVDTLGAGLKLESEIGRWVSFIYGGEFYYDMIGSERKVQDVSGHAEQDAEPQYPDDSIYTSAAGYLEVRATPLAWMKLVPGVRYSYFQPDAELEDPELGTVEIDDSIDDVTWAFHSIFMPHAQHGIILGVSRGFRAPNLDELTRLGSEDGRYDVPNPDLDPEQMIQYEVGYRVSHPRIGGSLFGYYSDIENLITRKPTTWQGEEMIGQDRVNRNENVGEAYIYGAELQLDGVLVPKYILAGLAGAYTLGQNETDDEPIRRIPPPTGNAYLRLNWPQQNAWFEIAGDFAAKQERLSAADKSDSRIGPEGTDGFGVMHLRSGYHIIPYFEIQMAVENVFNERYKVHGSGPLEAGRNFKGQLSFLF